MSLMCNKIVMDKKKTTNIKLLIVTFLLLPWIIWNFKGSREGGDGAETAPPLETLHIFTLKWVFPDESCDSHSSLPLFTPLQPQTGGPRGGRLRTLGLILVFSSLFSSSPAGLFCPPLLWDSLLLFFYLSTLSFAVCSQTFGFGFGQEFNDRGLWLPCFSGPGPVRAVSAHLRFSTPRSPSRWWWRTDSSPWRWSPEWRNMQPTEGHEKKKKTNIRH